MVRQERASQKTDEESRNAVGLKHFSPDHVPPAWGPALPTVSARTVES